MVDAEFVRGIPKAELHAHLHGSIRQTTLTELLLKAPNSEELQTVIQQVIPKAGRSLKECFKIFGVLHAVVKTTAAVRRILAEMVHDCQKENIEYLEIRTTPRALDDGTIRAYVETLINELACGELRGCWKRESVRLLLSIDRTKTVESSTNLVQLAIEFSKLSTPAPTELLPCPDSSCPSHHYPVSQTNRTIEQKHHGPYIVGVDLSGDPLVGEAQQFFPALSLARQNGLKVAVHCGEVMNVRETEAILDWAPDRLGHACVLSHSTTSRLLNSPEWTHYQTSPISVQTRIPIEVCPTSNSLTLHLPSLDHHPTIGQLLAADYPFVICTDDSGVFGVTLSEEYLIVARTHKLTRVQVIKLAQQSFRFAFGTMSPETQAKLQHKFGKLLDNL